MARPLRIQFPGAFYHVMNRGISRAPLFFRETDDRALFKQTLADAVRLWKIRIHAFSLMDNHYHLLVETPLPNLSRAMQHIDGIYTQRFNRIHNRDGPLIRGRFKSILVQEESYFLELVRYIHLNGVRAQCFPSARVDTNCSHWDYLHPERAPTWLERGRVLARFSHDLAALDSFVHQGVSPNLEKILAKKRWPAILGADDFVESMRIRFLKSKIPSKDLPQVGEVQRLRLADPHHLIERVLEEYALLHRDEGQPCDGLDQEGRWVLFVGLRRWAHLTYQEIAILLGDVTYDAVHKFIARNNFFESPIFRRLERVMETSMSNVEI